MKLETVKVKGGPAGTRLVNARDFDPEIHERADAPEASGGRAKVSDLKAAIPNMSGEELEALEAEDDRPGVQKAVAAEKQSRAGA